MKKMILAIFCFLLTSCGTFNVKVQVPPKPVENTQPPATATLASTTSTPLGATATTDGQPFLTPTVPSAEAITLTMIKMTDPLNGWGVESFGRILKTSDGGGMWKNVTPQPTAFDRHGFFAFNEKLAWAVPLQLEGQNVVWRTQDGGNTWDASQPISLGAEKYSPLNIQFPDAQHGWLLVLAQDSEQNKHVELYKSENGGKAWALANDFDTNSFGESYLPESMTNMAFFDGQTGWLGGWWGKNDLTQWLIPNTGDGGKTWGEEILRLPAQTGLKCDGRPLAETAAGSMVVQMTCTTQKDAKYLFRHLYYLAANGKPTWQSWALTGDALGAYILNVRQGWLMVTSSNPQMNRILYTKNGGGEWVEMSKVTWKQAQFDFVTDKIGWAIAGNDSTTTLFRTENGGKIWVQVRPALFKP